MQPPPRKGNYAKFLKNLHSEQLAKLQMKNQNECDLLEDIRQFTLKRSAIEKSYSEALLKISSAYLNKKTPNIPEIKMDGADEKWNMWSVWTTVLEENEKLARARLAAVEVFQQQIADEAKCLRSYKVGNSKKFVEYLAVAQKELQLSVQDIDKNKKNYFDEEHSAHDVRDKARDIEEKLKKKKGSFFQSITSLQKNSARVTSRKEQLEEKSTGARNDYLLSLASANSHQNRYFTVDLQATMSNMENYVYERVADYLALIGRTELLTCSATQNSFGKIRDQANQLTREYNLQCIYLYYPVLKQHIQYEFEPCRNDAIRKITADHDSAADTLNREGKRWAARVARENNVIREYSRKLAVCQSLREAGHRSDPNDQNGPDLETKIEEFREIVRKSEVSKLKSEARLECLRQGGINVDEWIQEAETLSVHEMPRSASSLSMHTDASGQGENPSSDSFYDSDNAEQDHGCGASETFLQREVESADDNEFADSDEEEDDDIDMEQERKKIEQMATGWEDPMHIDWGHEEAASSPMPPAAPAPTQPPSQTFKCTALYSYTAQNPDELSIVESEQLEVVGEGDGDGWLRARNYRGEEGFVPHNYLDVERDIPIDTQQQAQLSNQISFSSVDYTVEAEDQDIMPDSGQSPDQISVISAPRKQSSQMYCIALYDYDATAEDELNFEEGQIIKLITKSPHGVDDGWWEGDLNGKVGNFPSLVVEECDEQGEPLTEPEDESPPPSAPPTSAPPMRFPLPVPPPMVLQEATPPEGQSPTIVNGSGEVAIDKFDFEPNDPQKQHGSQFNSHPVVICEEPEEEENQAKEEEQQSSVKDSKMEISLNNLSFVQINVTAATPCTDLAKPFPIEEEDEFSSDDNVVEKQEEETQENDATHKITEHSKESAPVVKRMSQKPPEPPVAQQQPQQQPMQVEEDKFEVDFDAHFEANFDDAFGNGNNNNNNNNNCAAFANNDAFAPSRIDDAFSSSSEPEIPKQVVGGRASIPEELEPHQLARLQNLKESNA